MMKIATPAVTEIKRSITHMRKYPPFLMSV